MSKGPAVPLTGGMSRPQRMRARAQAADLLPPFWSLVGWTAGVVAASYLVRWLASVDGRTFTVVWLAAAPQLVALLLARRRHWPAYLLTFSFFQYVPAWVLLDRPPELAALSTLTTVVFAAAMLHSDQDWIHGRTDSLRSWRRFVLYAVIVAPAFAGIIGALSVLVHQQGRTDPKSLCVVALIWYLAEAVGIAFLAPVLLRWRRYWRRHTARQVFMTGGYTLLMVALGTIAAYESNFVLMFLAAVPALLVLIEFGIAAAFWQMAAGAVIVLSATFAGMGPFVVTAVDRTDAMIHTQVFLLTGYAMVVLVAAALEERNRLTALDRASHEVYDLVAALTGDLVIVVDARGEVLHHAFTGHSDLNLPAGRIGRDQWRNEVHPDDLHIITEHWSAARTGASLPFRIKARDGSWRWLVMHTRRAARGLVAAVLRDVTLEREVQESLTDMANSDPLTGLANRRGLAGRAREIWMRALDRDEPLTALFVDVDHFKAYNDQFGHQAGDICLRAIAEVLGHLADASGCVAARYGGEEFALVLSGCEDPYTFATGLASAIRALGITHPQSPSGLVTVSVGVATLTPRDEVRFGGADPDVAVCELLDRADKALYSAKSKGRDAISVAHDDTLLVGEHVHHAAEYSRESVRGGHDE